MDKETYLRIDNIQTTISRCVDGVFRDELKSPNFSDTFIVTSKDVYMAIPYYVSDKYVYAVRCDDTLERGAVIVASISKQSEDRRVLESMAKKNYKIAEFFYSTLRAIRNASN